MIPCLRILGGVIVVIVAAMSGCVDTHVALTKKPIVVDAVIQLLPSQTERSLYTRKDAWVILNAFDLVNRSDSSLIIDSIQVLVSLVTKPVKSIASASVVLDVRAVPGATVKVHAIPVWHITPLVADGAYAIYIKSFVRPTDTGVELSADPAAAFCTFFRVADDSSHATYRVAAHKTAHGLPVFTMSQGLSAEYMVQKAAANITCGVSHSWFTRVAGAGPEPVLSTPDFVQRSVFETISFYDSLFGKAQPIENLIIATGLPSVAYLSRVLNAPVLPVHFLVGINSIKEIETILDVSQQHGLETYATIGHDTSLSGQKAVAWIKLLELPREYVEFIEHHQVKNVVLVGYTGTQAGEVTARRVSNPTASHEIYLMQLSASSLEYLSNMIFDLDEYDIGPVTRIADWESGLSLTQRDRLADDVEPFATAHSLTSANDIELWNLATYLYLRFFQKNRENPPSVGAMVKGVMLNPYLIAHPFYESTIQYIPFLYWQGFSADHHIESRLRTTIQQAVQEYFPEVEWSDLAFQVNSTQNFGGSWQALEMEMALAARGLKTERGNYYADEVWSPGDGSYSSVERCADAMTTRGLSQLKEWNDKVLFLDMDDLNQISERFPLLQWK